MKNADQPISPCIISQHKYSDEFFGLTKREHFAVLAMQGMLANITQGYGKPNVNEASMEDSLKREEQFISDVAIKSVKYADALLKALESPNPDNT